MARKGLSSVQRTIRALRNQGSICDIAEKWNPHVGPHGVRQDLFGFIDIIALSPDSITAIQCCSGSSYGSHLLKILDNEYAPLWLESGGKIEIWAWRKVKKKRGGKLMLWQPRIKEVTMRDFDETGGQLNVFQSAQGARHASAHKADNGVNP